MGQNKIHSNIYNNLQNDNIYINTYCSKCFKLLDDSNKNNIVKDIDNNFFCDKYCRSDFHKENYKLIEEVISY